MVRGQHRYFSAAVRLNSHWVTVNEAERIAHTTGARICDLARQGQVDAIFLKVRRGRSRTECWIRRESLNQWIATRDAELAPYMERPDAKEALGLTNRTIVTVAAAGVIRYLKGPEQNFPARCFFFLREDVMKIKDAFEKHSVPVKEYSKPGELIALRHAVKNYLGHVAGLAAVIRLWLMVVLCRRDARHVFEGSQATCSGPKISASTARRPTLRRHRKASSITGKRQPWRSEPMSFAA